MIIAENKQLMGVQEF